jgi:ATP adenylyltransferase
MGHLFVPGKHDYVRGVRPDVSCILCAIRDRDEKVISLELARTEKFIISLNLYPYNPGHLIIFPTRHVEKLGEMGDDETLELFELVKASLDVLEEEYEAPGFNVGMNLGKSAGASLTHLHLHIVPRYHAELGFVDILAGDKIVVEDPMKTAERLRSAFARKFRRDLKDKV